MAHNIEIKNGVASYAENGRRERAWHRLGQVFDGAMTVEEALKASHADYNVELQPVFAMSPKMSEHLAEENYPMQAFQDEVVEAVVPHKMATVRTDTNTVLGIVSDTYGVVQNVDAFRFVDTLCSGQVGDHSPVIECAGVLGQGERIFVTAKFPEDIILDNKGDDRVEMNMVFTTSHDGTGSVKCICTPVRVVCQNTLNFALTHNNGCLSLRHSSNIMNRLDLSSQENTEFAFKSMGLIQVYKRSLEVRFNRLRNIKLAERDLDKILAEVTLSENDYAKFLYGGIDNDEIAANGRNKFFAMKECVENGVGQDFGERGTGLWVANGITSYYQNQHNFRSEEVKFDSILHGYTHTKVMDACLAIENI